MANPRTIGALEFSSIGLGLLAQDTLLKAANVEVLIARTICSGKYLIVMGGSVSDVESAVATAGQVASEALIDQVVIPAIHESVFPALTQSVVLDADEIDTLGIVETFSGVSILAAADAAAKAANVKLYRIHVAMALGGKGFCLMNGPASDVQAAVRAAAADARQRGLLVSEVVIQRATKELFNDYI